MIKKVIYFISVIFFCSFIIGCAAVAKEIRHKTDIPVSGGVDSLQIEGPQQAMVGETITLTAVGYDEETAKILIPGLVHPKWECDKEGTLDGTEGVSVRFTALKPGLCFIKATQGKANMTHQVEIK